MTYANGRIPDSELGRIPGTTQRVRVDLLPQTIALRAAFLTALGSGLGVTDGYRSFFDQVVVKAKKPLLAATPGKSNHGLGTALDLGSGVNTFGSREHLWMRANAPAFGWFHPLWARQGGSKPEAWHWEASAGVVPVSSYRHIPGAVPHVPTVTPPAPLTPVQEDDMPIIVTTPSGSWLKDGARLDGLDLPARESCRAAGLREINISDALRETWARQTAPVPTLVRAPSRGVAILAGAGGFTALSSQDDVNRFAAAGAREVAVTDDDFSRLATEGA